MAPPLLQLQTSNISSPNLLGNITTSHSQYPPSTIIYLLVLELVVWVVVVVMVLAVVVVLVVVRMLPRVVLQMRCLCGQAS